MPSSEAGGARPGFFRRRAGKITLTVAAAPLVGALAVLGVLLTWSPGTSRPFLDADGDDLAGSISEKTSVTVDGVELGMFIKGTSTTNPVLLFLHGGPGVPEYGFTDAYPNRLAEDFTVVWLEQRGAGLSYSSTMDAASLTTDRLVTDTVEVTNYLRERFGQDKIYLMGHSWGTYLGMQAAERAPDLFHAYIGMAQISRTLESEKIAWEYMVDAYTREGDTKMVDRLEEFPIPELGVVPDEYADLRDEAMHDLGIGTVHEMDSMLKDLVLPVLRFPEYTLGEKIDNLRAKAFSRSSGLEAELMASDLTREIPRVEIPVYFFHGAYDYTVSYSEAKAYFDIIEAPLKGFYTFDESAHSPLFEEPDRLETIMRDDVLTGTADLADW